MRGGARARPALDWASVNMTSLAEESWSCRLVNLARGMLRVWHYTEISTWQRTAPPA